MSVPAAREAVRRGIAAIDAGERSLLEETAVDWCWEVR